MNDKKQKQGMIISFLVCLIITTFAIYFLIYLPIRQNKICTQSSEAVISEVKVYRGGIRDSAYCLNSDHNHTYKYSYSYTINGKNYSGYDYKQTQENTFCHKVGKKVAIKYNPENPSIFMLRLGVKDYLLMGIPVLFLLFTLMLGRAVIKQK